MWKCNLSVFIFLLLIGTGLIRMSIFSKLKTKRSINIRNNENIRLKGMLYEIEQSWFFKKRRLLVYSKFDIWCQLSYFQHQQSTVKLKCNPVKRWLTRRYVSVNIFQSGKFAWKVFKKTMSLENAFPNSFLAITLHLYYSFQDISVQMSQNLL